MAWSSYAHLPNNEEEYKGILSKLKNGMSTDEVDQVIAQVKCKEKVTNHYRNNLVRIGLLRFDKGRLHVLYDLEKLKKGKNNIKFILSDCLDRHKMDEVDAIRKIVSEEQSYDLTLVVERIWKENRRLEPKNLTRWIRPVVSMMKIADVLSETTEDTKSREKKLLAEAYMEISGGYGEIVSLQEIELELKKRHCELGVDELIETILLDFEVKFKMELLMLPKWATKSKIYIINKEYYTHIRIKTDL